MSDFILYRLELIHTGVSSIEDADEELSRYKRYK